MRRGTRSVTAYASQRARQGTVTARRSSPRAWRRRNQTSRTRALFGDHRHSRRRPRECSHSCSRPEGLERGVPRPRPARGVDAIPDGTPVDTAMTAWLLGLVLVSCSLGGLYGPRDRRPAQRVASSWLWGLLALASRSGRDRLQQYGTSRLDLLTRHFTEQCGGHGVPNVAGAPVGIRQRSSVGTPAAVEQLPQADIDDLYATPRRWAGETRTEIRETLGKQRSTRSSSDEGTRRAQARDVVVAPTAGDQVSIAPSAPQDAGSARSRPGTERR